jgi:hypothetical protein
VGTNPGKIGKSGQGRTFTYLRRLGSRTIDLIEDEKRRRRSSFPFVATEFGGRNNGTEALHDGDLWTNQRCSRSSKMA